MSQPDTIDQQTIENTVPGTDVKVYAHPSRTIPGSILVGIDAPEHQRLRVVVNDWDALDTTIGTDAGSGRVAAAPEPEDSAGLAEDTNAHMGNPIEVENGQQLLVSTRLDFEVPDEVVAKGLTAVHNWVANVSRSIIAAYPVHLVVDTSTEPA